MAAEKVTGEKGFVVLAPGEHRIGPMEEGRIDKLENLSAQIQGVIILDDLYIEIGHIGDAFEINCPGL